MEMSNMFAKAFLMLLLVVYHAHGDFTKYPQNTAAVEGDTVLFECQPKQGPLGDLIWMYATSTSSAQITLGSKVSSTYTDRAKLDYDENTLVYNLHLNTTADVSIQQYSCADFDDITAFADLILLDTTPSCGVSANLTDLIEGESFTVECTANYKSRPNWNAQLKCRINGEDQPTEDSGTDGMLKGSFTAVSKTALHGHSYLCEISFPAPPVIVDDTKDQIYNKDAPKYIFTYSTDKLNVQFEAQKLDILNKKEEYYPGDRVTCKAEGRPAVSYVWKEVKADGDVTVSLTDVMKIKESMVVKTNRYRCEASNTIKNTVYSVNETIEFTVSIPTTAPPMTTVPVTTTDTVPTVPPPAGLSGGAIAGIVIGVVLALLLIFLLLLFLIIRSRRPAKKKAQPKPASSSLPQQIGHTLPPAYSPPPRKVDNDGLGMFVRDNTVGSRKPLPAEEPGAYVNNSFGHEYI